MVMTCAYADMESVAHHELPLECALRAKHIQCNDNSDDQKLNQHSPYCLQLDVYSLRRAKNKKIKEKLGALAAVLFKQSTQENMGTLYSLFISTTELTYMFISIQSRGCVNGLFTRRVRQ